MHTTQEGYKISILKLSSRNILTLHRPFLEGQPKIQLGLQSGGRQVSLCELANGHQSTLRPNHQNAKNGTWKKHKNVCKVRVCPKFVFQIWHLLISSSSTIHQPLQQAKRSFMIFASCGVYLQDATIVNESFVMCNGQLIKVS